MGRPMTRTVAIKGQLNVQLTSYSEQIYREVEPFLSPYTFGGILFSQVIASSWRSKDSVVGIISG